MTNQNRRQSVNRFADSMEKTLRTNDHKGRYGWSGWQKVSIFRLLMVEVGELALAIAKNNEDAIRDEACDVANFAMMIYDRRTT